MMQCVNMQKQWRCRLGKNKDLQVKIDHQEAVVGDPNRFSEQKSKKCQKYVDYRKKFKYSVSDGSILAYYNGADYTFTWEQGRQLASVTKGNKTASYTYDMSGVRSSKTVNGVSYEYTTLSGKITRMT